MAIHIPVVAGAAGVQMGDVLESVASPITMHCFVLGNGVDPFAFIGNGNTWVGRHYEDTSTGLEYDLESASGLRARGHNGSSFVTSTQGWGGSAGTWYSCWFFKSSSEIGCGIYQPGVGEFTDFETLSGNLRGDVIGGQNFTVGSNNNGGGQAPNRRFAEVAFWNVTLNADERDAINKGVSAMLIRPTALIAYWPLVGIFNGTTFRDGNMATSTSRVGGYSQERWATSVEDPAMHPYTGKAWV